jgi:HSP20 family molecular chaperone IbpA
MALFPRAGDFAPLFRLLDDYDVHRSGRSDNSITRFAPRFDVRETKDSYHLDGELPGIAQENIEIEFSDPQTLVIRGRVQREYHSPDGSGESVEADKADSTTAVQKTADSNDKDKQTSKPIAQHKYWVSERSVGEFHRSFNFPNRVDQDHVKASLKNGILSIAVPKAAPPTGKKITIE